MSIIIIIIIIIIKSTKGRLDIVNRFFFWLKVNSCTLDRFSGLDFPIIYNIKKSIL